MQIFNFNIDNFITKIKDYADIIISFVKTNFNNIISIRTVDFTPGNILNSTGIIFNFIKSIFYILLFLTLLVFSSSIFEIIKTFFKIIFYPFKLIFKLIFVIIKIFISTKKPTNKPQQTSITFLENTNEFYKKQNNELLNKVLKLQEVLRKTEKTKKGAKKNEKK